MIDGLQAASGSSAIVNDRSKLPMRLLIASGIFHPEPGGPATYLYEILPAFVQAGHQVTVLSYGSGAAEAYPYSVTRIPRSSYPLRLAAYRQAADRLWPGHDLVYLHSLGLPLPPRCGPRVAKIVGDIAWERASNKRWIAGQISVDEFQVRRLAPHVEINKVLRAHEARRLDHIIVPSHYLERMLLGWGVQPERLSVIYNALPARPPEAGLNRAEARTYLAIPADCPLLFAPARLVVWKGLQHILHALRDVQDVCMVIAGDGPLRGELEALTQAFGLVSRVRLVGRIGKDVMAYYYAAADYTILYSGYEGLSHVLIESLQAGTPVIASDAGGNPEIVSHGVNGLLVPYPDVAALIEAIRSAFGGTLRADLAAQAHRGLGRFGWDRMVRDTLAVLGRFG